MCYIAARCIRTAIIKNLLHVQAVLSLVLLHGFLVEINATERIKDERRSIRKMGLNGKIEEKFKKYRYRYLKKKGYKIGITT
jgi:hypothetical protein